MTRADIAKLKHEIHVFGHILGMKDAKATAAELAELKKTPSLTWKAYKSEDVHWNYAAIAKRYIQLVAFRSQLRGRLHFAPTTNLEEAHFIYGVPCLAGPMWKTGLPEHVFTPITLEVQGEWVKDLYEEFALKEVVPDHQRVA